MNRTRLPAVLATAALLIGTAVVSGGGAVAAPAPERAVTVAAAAPAAAPAATRQSAKWYWSDGYRYLTRTFREWKYPTRASLPKLYVKMSSSYPARKVVLEYWDNSDNRWERESSQWTNGKGIATVRFDPFNCTGAGYCDGFWYYRLRILAGSGQGELKSNKFRITFVAA